MDVERGLFQIAVTEQQLDGAQVGTASWRRVAKQWRSTGGNRQSRGMEADWGNIKLNGNWVTDTPTQYFVRGGGAPQRSARPPCGLR